MNPSNRLSWPEAARQYNAKARVEAKCLHEIWQQDKSIKDFAGKVLSIGGIGSVLCKTNVPGLFISVVGAVVAWAPEVPEPSVIIVPESLDNVSGPAQSIYWDVLNRHFGRGRIDPPTTNTKPIINYTIYLPELTLIKK